MPVLRGTKLALAGAVGAVLARWFEVGERLREYESVESALELPTVRSLVAEYGALLDWTVGVFVGVAAADLVGALRARNANRDVRLSSTLGAGKGAAAVVAGTAALAYEETLFDEFARRVPDAAAVVATYPGGEAAFCFAVGVWVGAVVASAARL